VSTALNRLIRDQILIGAPAVFNGGSMVQWLTQESYVDRQESYIDGQLNSMTNAELLERISVALELILKGDPRA
jgi:hypothetical protein